jgi:hypothetical protein
MSWWRRKTRTVTMTPAEARKLLTQHAAYDHFDQRKITCLAAKMLGGTWRTGGPPIQLTRDGTYVCDGQHRLQAVCLANVPIRMKVTVTNTNLVTHRAEDGTVMGWSLA